MKITITPHSQQQQESSKPMINRDANPLSLGLRIFKSLNHRKSVHSPTNPYSNHNNNKENTNGNISMNDHNESQPSQHLQHQQYEQIKKRNKSIKKLKNQYIQYNVDKQYHNNEKQKSLIFQHKSSNKSFKDIGNGSRAEICGNGSRAEIICEGLSRDGQYKVISRALFGENLKKAVELEYKMNMKSRKAHSRIADEETVSTPQAKISLDPSKTSTKANGLIHAYAVNTNQGISRKYNEDRVSIILNINKNGVKSSFFAIYDGHGGSMCCDFLSENLHQYILNSKKFPANPRQAIIDGMKMAEDKFIESVKSANGNLLKKEFDKSGSCAIVALIVGGDCYVANVGDSRAILSTCQGKPLFSLSRDHKPTDTGEQNRILKEGGKIYRTQMERKSKQAQSKANEVVIGPLRAFPGKLSVTRTFGDIEAKDPQFGGIKNSIISDPQICKYTLTGKEDFILLGCDGIFQKLDSEQVMEQAWKSIRKSKHKDLHASCGSAAQAVVRLCMQRKSMDNLTAIIICLSDLSAGGNMEEYRSL